MLTLNTVPLPSISSDDQGSRKTNNKSIPSRETTPIIKYSLPPTKNDPLILSVFQASQEPMLIRRKPNLNEATSVADIFTSTESLNSYKSQQHLDSKNSKSNLKPKKKISFAPTVSSKNIKLGSGADKSQHQPSEKISQRLNPSAIDPMGKEHHKTLFSSIYSRSGIPCRLIHGSVKHNISWSTPPSKLNYNPIFITFLEGLREIEHPYSFIVRNGLIEMLDAYQAKEKIRPLMGSCVKPLRAALSHPDKKIVVTALQIFGHLAKIMGPDILSILPVLLPPVASQVMKSDSEWREIVLNTLMQIENYAGEAALKLIKAKVPTYTPASGF